MYLMGEKTGGFGALMVHSSVPRMQSFRPQRNKKRVISKTVFIVDCGVITAIHRPNQREISGACVMSVFRGGDTVVFWGAHFSTDCFRPTVFCWLLFLHRRAATCLCSNNVPSFVLVRCLMRVWWPICAKTKFYQHNNTQEQK